MAGSESGGVMVATPNYGWVMPDPTDFVTNLPADFEIFGDAVDADLAGLLGGTTGTVLLKNSGTDHDFAFATPPFAPKAVTLNAQTGTTYTLVLADDSKLITYNNASPITVTVPLNSSVAFPTGTQIHGIQIGAGQVTVNGAVGVTVSGIGSRESRVQFSAFTLIKVATDAWYIIGDIE